MLKRFQEEGEKLGHNVEGCYAADLVLEGSGNKFSGRVNGMELAEYDLIYLCTGVEGKGRWDWYIACDSLKNSRTKIVNAVVIDPKFNYFPTPSWFFLKQFENTIDYPLSYVVYDYENALESSRKLGFPLILKVGNVHQGKAIYLIENEKNLGTIITQNPDQLYILRKFIPNDGDIRIFVVGGRAIGAMKRIPKRGEFRSNISVGGVGEKFDLSKHKDIKGMAEKAAKVTGIEVAGVDIIIDKQIGKAYVLEVNVGPQFAGLEKYTGVNAAKEIIQYFVEKASK
jgi:glutathione synthase/RimK-type ligase-like ATP-grasp enzyme